MEKSEQPKATLDDLLAELKAQGARRKDFRDRLPMNSTFISTVVLGVAGLWFPHSYNQRQAALSVAFAVKLPQAAPEPPRPQPAATGTKGGWVYLGHYVAPERCWETRYFDFPESADPASLVGSSPAVRSQTGNINVRAGMPTESGAGLRCARRSRPGIGSRYCRSGNGPTPGTCGPRLITCLNDPGVGVFAVQMPGH